MQDLAHFDNSQNMPEMVPMPQPFGAPGGGGESEPGPSLLTPLLRYWKMILIIFVVVCAIGIPSVYYFVKPVYKGTAVIRVARVMQSVLGEAQAMTGAVYDTYRKDQSLMMMSDHRILQRVVDDLADQNLQFFAPETGLFAKKSTPLQKLRNNIDMGNIDVYPVKDSELIKVEVVLPDKDEAVQIADAISKAYMAIVGSRASQKQDEHLDALKKQERVQAEKLSQQRARIRELADEYGSIVLTPRQEMMLSRVATLRDLVTEIEADKILLETKVELLEKMKDGMLPTEDLMEKRFEYVQNDLLYQALTRRLAKLQEELITAKQILTDQNPQLKKSVKLLESFKESLQEREEELKAAFDATIDEELARDRDRELQLAKAELESLRVRKQILEDKLQKEDLDTINLGRKQLEIQEAQEDMNLTKEIHDEIRKKIRRYEVENTSEEYVRASIPYDPVGRNMDNKRMKGMAAVAFFGLAAGAGLAIMLDRANNRIMTPEQTIKKVGARVIGTTTSIRGVKRSILPQQVREDYRSILMNLGLLDVEGIPRKIVVTSPSVGDGKTTFAVNLCASLALTGKKILLVDGDLRKPDIGKLLNIPRESHGISEIVLEGNTEGAIHRIESGGFDVLTAGAKNIAQSFKLLSLRRMEEYLTEIESAYDHIIVDTPPVLAFPDALLWSKMVDAVIVTSFVGRTVQDDLKKTLDRLKQIQVNVMGTVLNSVGPQYTSSRYASYYSDQARKDIKERESILMLPQDKKKG